MKILLTKIKTSSSIDITQTVRKTTWSGSIEEIARTLSIDMLNAPYDPILRKLPRPGIGDRLSLIDDTDTERFSGKISAADRASAQGTLTYTATDDGQYLQRNSASYSFSKTTAEQIARKVLGEFGVPVGSLAKTGVMIRSLVCKDKSLYDIIMAAYTQAHRIDGKNYMLTTQDGKVCVVEMGAVIAGFTVSDEVNITDSKYSESSEDIVNTIVIVDSKGKKVGTVSDAESIATYGRYQQIMTQTKGKNATLEAKNKIKASKTPSQSESITLISDNLDIQAGRAITVQDTATKLKGLYWIQSDSHEVENGISKITLELDFKKIMSEADTS